MEEHMETGREVVETYRQPDPREVVEVYIRPLPKYGLPRPTATKGRSHRGLWIFLLCFAFIVLLALATGIWSHMARSSENPSAKDSESEMSGESAIPTYPIGQGAELRLVGEAGEMLTAQEIYQRVNPSVVTVMVGRGSSMSVGTGVIFTEDGYVITNDHVLSGGSHCFVALDTGGVYEARLVAGDAANDLAVLKINGTNFPAASFGNSDLLAVGDRVYAIGNPLGVELRGTLTDGLVSAINRDVWVDGRYMTLIQTNAALNSGNSGGPLVNEFGQVVGINVIKMTSRYSSVEGLGFAIPASDMERIVNDLLTYGSLQPEPLLGVTVMPQAEEAAKGVWGLRVKSVQPDGAADLAGVREGDFILTVNGVKLNASQDLLRTRRKLHLGDTMSMVLWRGDEEIKVTLELNEPVEEEEQVPPWYVK